MAFKTVDATGRTAGRSASMDMQLSYYGKTAQFRLTPSAVRALGMPDKVEVQFDDETRRIAFVASEASHAVTLRHDGEEQTSRYFGFRAFANLIGLNDSQRIIIELDDEDGTLIGQLPPAADEAEAE